MTSKPSNPPPTGPPTPLTHALSFDIEDWFHVVGVAAAPKPEDWASQRDSLVERYTDWIVETLAEYDVRATFFMLGWVAEHHPGLARRIADAGHEVACHSYWHPRVETLTPDEFREDTRRSKGVIEDQIGRPLQGYRAPSFSITPGTEWAFDILLDEGFTYDASLFPAPRGHGGYDCPQEAHDFTNTPSGRTIRELPMSILRLGPLKAPFSGGGYLRVLPEWVIRRGFENFEKAGVPVVTYLHPRDFAPDCPRIPMPLHRRFKCYTGMKSAPGKLRMMLERYKFDTCAAVARAPEAAPAASAGGA